MLLLADRLTDAKVFKNKLYKIFHLFYKRNFKNNF